MKSKANLVLLKSEQQSNRKQDLLKWCVAVFLIVAAITANYYFSDVLVYLRILLWLLIFGLAGFVISKTDKGRQIFAFARDARAELRKVVWPTREETTHTTIVVGVMVVILALMLWGVDGVLVWLIGLLTGQRT